MINLGGWLYGRPFFIPFYLMILSESIVFIVLSARALNPTIQIIIRASEASSMSKMKKAGANSVIMPDYIGGTHMATLVTKSDVVEFIDFLSAEQGNSIHIESLGYENLPTEIKGKSLREIMN